MPWRIFSITEKWFAKQISSRALGVADSRDFLKGAVLHAFFKWVILKQFIFLSSFLSYNLLQILHILMLMNIFVSSS